MEKNKKIGKNNINKVFKIVVLRQRYISACARQQQRREDVYDLKMTLTFGPQTASLFLDPAEKS